MTLCLYFNGCCRCGGEEALATQRKSMELPANLKVKQNSVFPAAPPMIFFVTNIIDK